jgi:hypothetical protein
VNQIQGGYEADSHEERNKTQEQDRDKDTTKEIHVDAADEYIPPEITDLEHIGLSRTLAMNLFKKAGVDRVRIVLDQVSEGVARGELRNPAGFARSLLAE